MKTYPAAILERTSDVLTRLARDDTDDDLTLNELLVALGDRAFGPLMLIFALPMALPMPPGLSAIFGVPLMMISLQIMCGIPRLWLPKKLGNQRIARKHLIGMVKVFVPILKKFEFFLRPRLQFMSRPWVERLTGLMLFFMAFLIFLPIPGGNMIPAVVMIVMAVGYIEDDGLVIAIGHFLGLSTIVVLGLSLELLAKYIMKMFA